MLALRSWVDMADGLGSTERSSTAVGLSGWCERLTGHACNLSEVHMDHGSAWVSYTGSLTYQVTLALGRSRLQGRRRAPDTPLRPIRYHGKVLPHPHQSCTVCELSHTGTPSPRRSDQSEAPSPNGAASSNGIKSQRNSR